VEQGDQKVVFKKKRRLLLEGQERETLKKKSSREQERGGSAGSAGQRRSPESKSPTWRLTCKISYKEEEFTKNRAGGPSPRRGLGWPREITGKKEGVNLSEEDIHQKKHHSGQRIGREAGGGQKKKKGQKTTSPGLLERGGRKR